MRRELMWHDQGAKRPNENRLSSEHHSDEWEVKNRIEELKPLSLY